MKILLASSSKYRRQLLARFQVPFDWASPSFDEDKFKDGSMSPTALALFLAHEKAKSLVSEYSEYIIIGGDQVLSFNGELLGKTGNVLKSIMQLKTLRGQTHELHTAVSIHYKGAFFEYCENTKLQMRELSDDEIRRYVAKDNPIDCAGSYKLESLGVSLFSKIEGNDLTAVEGLPLLYLSKKLRELGLLIP